MAHTAVNDRIYYKCRDVMHIAWSQLRPQTTHNSHVDDIIYEGVFRAIQVDIINQILGNFNPFTDEDKAG